ncbi:hypothetical protein AALP_AAs44396U000200 [Arabis alpina]|uniref:Uncharacterized protein n=1 Tax=Arabis alpina TaxID=50452 RepID=A0A087FXF2_ARAAL|nr:hypothetical protein AALP_AAs44396U000200 [Arabis alpina]
MVGVSELVDRCYSTVRKVVLARGCFDDTKGAMLIQNLAAKEPVALGLDTYYKQHYLSLAAAAATIKWIEAEKGVIVTNHSLTDELMSNAQHQKHLVEQHVNDIPQPSIRGLAILMLSLTIQEDNKQ